LSFAAARHGGGLIHRFPGGASSSARLTTRSATRERTQDAVDTLFAIMKDPKAPAAARVSARSHP
jgi:hypothetical protein